MRESFGCILGLLYWSSTTHHSFIKIQNAIFQLTSREKAAKDYNQKLKEKFQYHPHIRRIARHRHLPKSIYSQIQEQRIMKEARRRKYVLGHLTLSQYPFLTSPLVLPKTNKKPFLSREEFTCCYILEMFLKTSLSFSLLIKGEATNIRLWEFLIPVFENMFKGQKMKITFIKIKKMLQLMLKAIVNR